jgi:hypothetical protein
VNKYRRGGHATDDNTIQRIRIACWIPKATDTPSQYLTRNACLLQQWLHELAPRISFVHIFARLVFSANMYMCHSVLE